MRLSVDDIIESFFAHMKFDVAQICLDPSLVKIKEHVRQSLKRASIFYMGSVMDVEAVINEDAMVRDLWDDLTGGPPMPFDDFVMITKMETEDHQKKPEFQSSLLQYNPVQKQEFLRQLKGTWQISYVTKLPFDALPDDQKAKPLVKECADRIYMLHEQAYMEGPKVWIRSFMRVLGWRGQGVRDGEQFSVMGSTPPGNDPSVPPLGFVNILSEKWNEGHQDKWTQASDSMRVTMFMIPLISHPMHYIVREVPTLNSSEGARAVKKGFPDRKRPRYLMVDHSVLVRMTHGKTHEEAEEEEIRASPVPHKRRGHWRRLAERCAHAKERGDKVWVRPTYIGAKEFEQAGRKYHVIMDFGINKPPPEDPSFGLMNRN